MTTDANKALVRRFVQEVFEQGRTDAVDELVAPDFVSHTWGIGEDGPARLKATMLRVHAGLTLRVHAGLTDISFTSHDLVADGDRVVARVTSSATVTGDFMGMPAAGKHYTIGEMHLFRIRDGRIAEHSHRYDRFGLLQQLGAIPADLPQAELPGADRRRRTHVTEVVTTPAEPG